VHESTGAEAAVTRVVPADGGATFTLKAQTYLMTAEQLSRLFWAKIDRQGPQGCWLWTGRTLPTGYGQARFAGRHWYSHRLSFELHKGPIPDGLHIDHLCRVRACCNPEHLDAVTCKVNVHRSPIAPAALNALKTHCGRGHEFTEANTIPRKRGRSCRICARWRQRVKEAEARGVQAETAPPVTLNTRSQDVCVAGHRWTDVNTYTRPDGARECRECRAGRRRAWAQKQTKKVAR
jgi:hypothetical protein